MRDKASGRVAALAVGVVLIMGLSWLLFTTPGVSNTYPADHGVDTVLAADASLDRAMVRCLVETLERGRGPIPDVEDGFVLRGEGHGVLHVAAARGGMTLQFVEGYTYMVDRPFDGDSGHLLHCPTIGLVDQDQLAAEREQEFATTACSSFVGIRVTAEQGGPHVHPFAGHPEHEQRCDWSGDGRVGIGTEADDGPLVPVTFAPDGTADPPLFEVTNTCGRATVAVLYWRGQRFTEPLHPDVCHEPTQPIVINRVDRD